MDRSKGLLSIGWLIATVAFASCDRAPLAPVGAPSALGISFGSSSLQLTRNSTTQLAVIASLSNETTRDVTADAVWGSSDPSVVTAERGLVRAVSIGTAKIFAIYQGRTATADVTTRRNMRVRGQVVIADARRYNTLEAAEVQLEGRRIAYADCRCDYSGYYPSFTLELGRASEEAANATVAPGLRDLAVIVYVSSSSQPLVTDETSSYVEVIDTDTGELLGRMALSRQQKTLSDGGRFSWSIVVEDVR